MKPNPTQPNSKKVTRVFLINKRDKIDEYISNCVAKYNEFLSKKDEPKDLKDLNNLLKNKDDFFSKSVAIFNQVEAMKTEILSKRDKFVAAIKEYAHAFINDQKTLARQKVMEIESNQEAIISKLNKEIEMLDAEKANLRTLKNDASAAVRAKINEIKDELNKEYKFNLKLESEKIKKIHQEHKNFIKTKVEDKVVALSTKLKSHYDEIKKQTVRRMDNIAQVIKNAKELIKKEFVFLAEIERKIIKKIIYFKDFLEDVEYFTNDKTRKYEIVLANAQKIKVDSSQKIMQDLNNLLSFISESDKIFDTANLLITGISQRANNKFLKHKLSNYKENVLNATTSKLLVDKIKEEF